jgi:hypothetical protein
MQNIQQSAAKCSAARQEFVTSSAACQWPSYSPMTDVIRYRSISLLSHMQPSICTPSIDLAKLPCPLLTRQIVLTCLPWPDNRLFTKHPPSEILNKECLGNALVLHGSKCIACDVTHKGAFTERGDDLRQFDLCTVSRVDSSIPKHDRGNLYVYYTQSIWRFDSHERSQHQSLLDTWHRLTNVRYQFVKRLLCRPNRIWTTHKQSRCTHLTYGDLDKC